MTTPTTPRAELAAAVRAVNAAYFRLPDNARNKVEIAYHGLEGEITASMLVGDDDRARSAIRAWRGHWLHKLGAAAR